MWQFHNDECLFNVRQRMEVRPHSLFMRVKMIDRHSSFLMKMCCNILINLIRIIIIISMHQTNEQICKQTGERKREQKRLFLFRLKPLFVLLHFYS